MSELRQGLGLLRAPNVQRLFIAYLITYSGTAMAPIAMAFGVLELTGSTRDASIVIAAPTAASIVVLLFGGVIADRVSRQRVIVAAELAAMGAQLVLGYLFLSDTASIPLLTTFMLVNGVAMAFHAPAVAGLIVQLVDKHDLQATNAILGIARNSATIGGAALGGMLVALVGAGWTLLADAATFAVSALLVAGLTPRAQRPPEAASLLEDLRLGWREFTRHTWLWTIVLQFSLVVAAIDATFGLLGPAVARDALGGPTHWGFIMAGFGLGTLGGGLLAIRLRPVHPMLLGSCLVFVFAAIPMTLAVPLHTSWIIVAAVAGGFAGQIFGVLWYTTLQRKVPSELLSRVSAYDHMGSIVLAPLGIVVGGILYEALGPRATLLIAAAAIIVPTLAVLCVHDVRTMTTTSD